MEYHTLTPLAEMRENGPQKTSFVCVEMRGGKVSFEPPYLQTQNGVELESFIYLFSFHLLLFRDHNPFHQQQIIVFPTN